MADERTQVTELGTAAGMVLGEAHADLDLLPAVEIPGVRDAVWRPPLEAAAEPWHRHHGILRAALANGAAFRAAVLKGSDPDRIDWRGSARAMWVSDAPVDLRVNDVYLVSAKYDSVCLLNRAPASVFDDLLASKAGARRPSWYGEVAPGEYRCLYGALVEALEDEGLAGADEFPDEPAGLTRDHRVHLKYLMKPWTQTIPDGARAAYDALCAAASQATAARWGASLARASEAAKLTMLAQMIRLSGTVYWLLGQAGDRPVRCRVSDAGTLRDVYRLRSFATAVPPLVGQPRVDWKATLEPRRGAVGVEPRTVDGVCEIRWSHGKFQGNPECKVQLRTPVWKLPGYDVLPA